MAEVSDEEERHGSGRRKGERIENAEKHEGKARKSKRKHEESDQASSSSSSDSDSRSHKRSSRRRHHRRRAKESSSSSSGSENESESSGDERHSRKRHRKEKGEERERRHRLKEKKRKVKRKEEKKKKRKERVERQKRGPVTASWGKYGLIKEIDMWNKRPEFSAWLAEVKKVNLETLPNWEERQMFKEYMEDYNTATFPSKKYYNVDKYHHQKMMKRIKKGLAARSEVERTEFNDEEQRRQEIKMQREHEKEAQLEELKHSMRDGMAQAMREQAQLREEMQYKYRLGNVEAANAIQRRLEPDIV